MSKHHAEQEKNSSKAKIEETTAEDSQVPEGGETAPMAEAAPEMQAESARADQTEAANGAEAGETGVADGAGAPEEPKTPEERVAELEEHLAEAKGDFLRKAADFENFRKRMNAEKQSAIDFANQALLLDIIPVIDDFERAIKAAETQREAAGDDAEKIAASYDSLHEGISMIEKRLVSQLENKWGLKRYDSAGEPFDPNRHEAIMMEKSADVAEPVVAEDFIKGYALKDRVVRAAKVKVIMPENA